MNIVFVVDNYNSKTDGTNITARRFEKELIRLGHSVKIVSYGVQGENRYGLKEHYMPIVSPVSRKSKMVFAKFDKKIMREAFTGADVVHLFLPFQAECKALKLAKKMGIAVTAAFHLHPENITKNIGIKKCPGFLRKLLFWRWRKALFDKVGHIHCPSQFTADELKRHGYKAKLHVISNGVAPQFTPPVPSYYNTENKKFEILMVGRLAAEKRQDLLLKAVASSKYKDDIEITFAGGGPMKARYEKMAAVLGLNPVFKFFEQDELINKIRSSDLYVHAADIEIEGISCIEAFSCGLVPVIGNAEKSATKQFIIDPRCGFEAGNADDLRAKIEYWYESREELAQMSLMYAGYAQEYTLEASVEKCLAMFRAAIGPRKNFGSHLRKAA